MSFAALTREFEDGLKLAAPPVGLARSSAPPSGVPTLRKTVPSACSLWREAEVATFFAEAHAHMNCPIGAMVMGFELSDQKSAELMQLVEQMCGMGYVEQREVARIPRLQAAAVGIVYGPLASFPIVPELVLAWLAPAQAMLLEEALGGTSWTSPGASAFGRPACAALPVAYGKQLPTLSLGCAGMRTFTAARPDHMLGVLPFSALSGLAEKIRSTLDVNEKMRNFYENRKATPLAS